MKIIVPIKSVVDPYVKVPVLSKQQQINTHSLKKVINPFCEIALEEALRLQDLGFVSEVVLLTIGSELAQEQLRAGLALGADRAILVQADAPVLPLSIAKIIRHFTLKEQAGLVLMGKQSIDGDNSQTGPMLAELLGWPQGTFASALKFNEKFIEVTRELDEGLQTLSMALPAVVTTDLRLNEPRYASLPNIMKARQKPLKVVTLAELGLDLKVHQEVLEITPPAARAQGIMVGSVQELVHKLKHDAGVIG
jgi:electron transfer flavoprotein beta subunit